MNKFEFRRIHLDEDGVAKIDLKDHKDKSVIGLFLEMEGDDYRLRVTEALVRDLATVLKSYSLEVDYQSNITEDRIPLKLAELLRYLGGTVEYLINSTSWREKKLYDFDRYELGNNIKVLENLIKAFYLK